MKRTPLQLIAPVVAALQTLVLLVIAAITLIGSLATREFEVRVLLPELLLYAIFIAGMGLVARGLWRAASWAKAPMIAVQLIAIGISYEDFWSSAQLGWKIFAVGLVALAVLAITSTIKQPSAELE
jgi:hypothetical protein